MVSQILIVVTGAIALLITAIGYFMFTPLFLEIMEQFDSNDNENYQRIQDRWYDVWFIMFEVFIGGIFLVMFMRAARKDSQEDFTFE